MVYITDSKCDLIATYTYDEWGKLLSIETAKENNADQLKVAETNPLRYRGYYYDNETGYYYLQSRYYDPDLGRFISADSFNYIDTSTPVSVNAYAYCANNPLIYRDPKGTAYVSEVGQAVAEIISSLFLCWDALEFGGEDFAYWIAGGILLDHENIFGDLNTGSWYKEQKFSFKLLEFSGFYDEIKLLDSEIFKKFYDNVVKFSKDTFSEIISGVKISIRYVYEPVKELLGYCVMGVLKYMRIAFDEGLTIFYSFIKFDFKLESSKLKIKETFAYFSMYILMEWELNLPSHDLTPVLNGIFTAEWLAIIQKLVELALSMLAAGVEIFI